MGKGGSGGCVTKATPKFVEVDLKPVKSFRYSQLNNRGFSFALLNKEGKALHTPFMCKDYLQDIFWSENTGASGGIYGLKWEKGIVDNIKARRFRVAILGGEFKMRHRVPFIKKLINAFD